MNVLFISVTEIIPSAGGVERVTYSIGESLKKLGNNVFYLTIFSCLKSEKVRNRKNRYFLPSGLTENKLINWLKIFCKNKQITHIINTNGDFSHFGIHKRYFNPNVKLISCLHFDIVARVTYFNHNYYKRGFFNRFIVCFFLQFGFNIPRFRYYLRLKKYYKALCNLSNCIIVPSNIMISQLMQICKNETVPVYQIANPYPFSLSDNMKNDSKENIMLYVGRLAQEKQVDYILEAWSKLPNSFAGWKLLIIGDGECRKELEGIKTKLALNNVTFLGRVEDVLLYYKKAKVLLLSSKCESFGNVVLEAIMNRVYPISFDYPALRELITDISIGRIVYDKTPEGLANAIIESVNHFSTIRSDVYLEEYIAKYSIDVIINEWEKLLLSL